MSTNPITAVNWQEEAEVFYAAGLRVIPFWVKDGNFGMPSGWREKYAKCDLSVLRDPIFWEKYGKIATGLALLTTDGIEAIDVDHKADPTGNIKSEYINAVRDLGGEHILEKCITVYTKSKGLHFVYRAENTQGNQKLAAHPKKTDIKIKPETLVETRGEGGLLFVAPTKGYRLTGEHYSKIQTITPEERNLLIQAGRVCDRMPEASNVAKKEIREASRSIPKGDGVTPWDAFNDATDVLDMMEALGWTVLNQSGDFIRLNRPDHKNARQASGSVIRSTNCFYPFTTSTVFESERGYSPYAVYALTVHGGDFSAAAKALYSDGFGDRRGAPETRKLDGGKESTDAAVSAVLSENKIAPVDAADELSQLIAEVDNEYTFDLDQEIEEIEFCMFYKNPETGKEVGVSAMGMFGLLVGLQKSGKTTLLIAFVVAALTDGEFLNFRFDLKGKSILWLDCEQPKYWFQLVCRRVYRLAGLRSNSPRLRAVSLRRYSKAQRAAITEVLILREKNLGLGIIDGLVDICQDFNEVKHSERTIDKVLEWSDRSGALVMGVIHLTKGTRQIKGHLGTIAQNKCDFALECSKGEGKGQFDVRHREARGVQIEDFTFYRDENGDPITADQHNALVCHGIAKLKAEERNGKDVPDIPPKKVYGATMQAVSKTNDDEDIPF